MSDSRKQDLDEFGVRLCLEGLFQALEDMSMRNRAYREAIRIEGKEEYWNPRVERAEEILRAQGELEKYSDLRKRAIESVEDHSLSELALLGREVQARVQIWGKP